MKAHDARTVLQRDLPPARKLGWIGVMQVMDSFFDRQNEEGKEGRKVGRVPGA